MLKALGEPMRLQIFQSLLQRKHCTRSLAKKLGITESAISQHLKVLREAELVYSKRCGYHVHYFSNQDATDFLAGEFAFHEIIKLKKRSATFTAHWSLSLA